MKHLRLLTLALSLSTLSTQACDLQKAFEALVKRSLGARSADAGFELRVIDRNTGNELCSASVNANKVVYPASAIKALVAFAVYRKVDLKEISLDQKVTITQSNANAECKVEGGCSLLAKGKQPTVRQLLERMITVSSNIATNQLADLVTKDFINSSSESLGLKNLHFYRKVYAQTPAENPMPPQRNDSTAQDFAGLYEEISTGRQHVLTDASRASLIALLGRGHFNDRLNRNWKGVPKFHHKPGNTSTVTSDAGFFYAGAQEDRIVIITGVQNFAAIKENGKSVSGYVTLSRVGDGVLKLVKGL